MKDNFEYQGYDNETRFVHRAETYTDVAIDELGKSRALCMCNKLFGRCTEDECVQCNKEKDFVDCFNSLSAYDQLRVKNRITYYFAHLQNNVDAYTPLSHDFLSIIIVFILLFAIVAIPLAYTENMTYDLVDSKYTHSSDPMSEVVWIETISREKEQYSPTFLGQTNTLDVSFDILLECLVIANKYVDKALDLYKNWGCVGDITKDWERNCQDYAVMFKCIFDYYFPTLTKHVKLVEISNSKYNFVHLGICVVYIDDHYIYYTYIEPQAHSLNLSYDLRKVWGEKMNGSRNVITTNHYMDKLKLRVKK